MEPMELFRAASAAPEVAAGFYNHNARVETRDGLLLVRIPIQDVDEMDLRVWPEHKVVEAVAARTDRVPKILYASASPSFQVYEYIDGELLDDIAPRGCEVPPVVLDDVAELFSAMALVPCDALPAPPAGWPADGDTRSFAGLLSAVTTAVDERFHKPYGSLFRDLGIPDAPVAAAVQGWDGLASRPFHLLHCDIHRKNMILRRGRVVFLDWELALWGDPLYDLAVHLHKMGYQNAEREAVTRAWVATLPADRTHRWEHDLGIYLAHERVKSAIVDSVRYAKEIATGARSPASERSLIDKLAHKLQAARTVWGVTRPLDPDRVERALRRDAQRRGGASDEAARDGP